jgi:predicted O-methyltransferase YrrM
MVLVAAENAPKAPCLSRLTCESAVGFQPLSFAPQYPCRSPARPVEEATISAEISAQSWEYADGFLAEDEILGHARQRAHEVGAVPIGPGGGAALRLLAAILDAKAVVEIGTGAGVSGVWLLRGMRPDGVLTTVDVEAEHHRMAREAFSEAGFAANRTRVITGRALDVLPRLSDGAYDLVFCDADKKEYTEYLAAAVRLLRPGGLVAFDNALWHDRVADPAQRDPETVAIRELGRTVRDDPRLVPALLPVGDGLLVAVKRPPYD